MDALYDFIVANRDELISRAGAKGSARPRLSASADDQRHGAARADGGEFHRRKLPGKGCIFAIELPLASPLNLPVLT